MRHTASLPRERPQRIYLAAGYYERNENYLGYPNLHAVGVGIEKLPDLDQRVSLYGSAYLYPDTKSNYLGPTSSLLGPLSGASFNLDYNVIRYEIGATYHVTMPFFIEAGFLGDRGYAHGDAPSDFTHNGAFIGGGLHL